MTRTKEILSKTAYYCFYVAVIIEVLLMLIDKSAYTNPFTGRIFQLTFLLFFIKVCLTKYTPKEYGTIFLFCVIGAVSYFVTDRNDVIRIVMFIAACKDIDIKKCLKLVFYVTLAGCIVIILLSVTGIYGSVSLTQEYRAGEVETRYTLGMGHPNALQCMVWALTTLGLYLYEEKMKWYHYLAVLAVNVAFFLLTNSRTSLLVTILIIALSFVQRVKRSEAIRRLSAAAEIFLTVASIAGSVVIAGCAYRIYDFIWNGDFSGITLFFVKLNDLLNGRIRILVENDTFEGTIQTWSLFSQPEHMERYFDMGWIRLFYWYGMIPACAFIIVLLGIMYYCYKEKLYAELLLIASFAVYSIIEAHAISVYLARNYGLFLIGQYWYQALAGEKDYVGKVRKL